MIEPMQTSISHEDLLLLDRILPRSHAVLNEIEKEYDESRRELTLEAINKLDFAAGQKERQAGFMKRVGAEASDEEGRLKRAEIEEKKRKSHAADMAHMGLDGVKNMLALKYGNLLRAWKLCLDADGSDKLTLDEFSRALRELGFKGNVK